MTDNILRSRMIDEVLIQLQEDPESPVFWTRDEIMDLLWEGDVELQLISGYQQSQEEVTLNGNSLQGNPDQIAILSVFCDDKALTKYSLDELDSRYPTWENDPPANVPRIWVAVGANQFITYPRTTSASLTITLNMIEIPETFTEDTVLTFDEEYSQALVFYGFHAARLKEGGAEFNQSMQAYQDFLRIAGTVTRRAEWKNAPGWTVPPKTSLSDMTPRQPGRR